MCAEVVFDSCRLPARSLGGTAPSRLLFPAMGDTVEDQLALLRSLLDRDFDFWVVKKVGQKGYHWSAKRKSDGAVVSGDDAGELIEALRRLASG